MSLRKLPKPNAFERPAHYHWDAPEIALSQWADGPAAAEADEPGTISIYDVIGYDWDGGGFTAKRTAAALRAIGKRDVTVNINSPGGDMFEGLAIYNILREHPAKVSVKVMGIAASAASIIAMAGDDVRMGSGSVLMIHNAWGLVIGNRHDFADSASVFQTFDQSMASIYSARTGLDEAKVLSMMDGPNQASDGTYMTASEALELGFADSVDDDAAQAGARAALPSGVLAKRKLDAALAARGMPRKERHALMREIQGQRDAAPNAMRDAGLLSAQLNQLLVTIQK